MKTRRLKAPLGEMMFESQSRLILITRHSSTHDQRNKKKIFIFLLLKHRFKFKFQNYSRFANGVEKFAISF